MGNHKTDHNFEEIKTMTNPLHEDLNKQFKDKKDKYNNKKLKQKFKKKYNNTYKGE